MDSRAEKGAETMKEEIKTFKRESKNIKSTST
jgi:hypothetical protein